MYNFKCYQTEDGKWVAVLIDFDLSSILEDDLRKMGATSKHRTGTSPFMARHLLRDLHGVDDLLLEHLYVFELESWFYIFLHVVTGCVTVIPADHPLTEWHDRNWGTVLQAKTAFFSEGTEGYDAVFESVSNCLQNKCTDVQSSNQIEKHEHHGKSSYYVEQIMDLFTVAIKNASVAKRNIRAKLRQDSNPSAILTQTERYRIDNDYLRKEVTYEKFMRALCPARDPSACRHEPFCEGELYGGAIKED